MNEKILKSKCGLEFVITGQDKSRSDGKHAYYFIKFIKSGFTDSVRSDIIRSGFVTDFKDRRLFGVACMGRRISENHTHEYKVWYNMISRCYNPQDISYEFYGAKGVKVCDRWLEFCNFFDDIKDIPGYDRELFNARLLRLDKDMRSGETKIYSPETVTLISDYQNQMIRTVEYNNIHVKYAVFPDGHIEKITNLSEFCKTHNIHRQNANLCLSGKQRSTKGFRFYRE